ncbi:MAG: LacI family DNA-binding transcriptional regulator [Spirochaetales bacterium]|nr:LacI family DNA-binding transcriptional regulator [Spirochaetales bacterium]
MLTMNDIAELSGCARSTVYAVLNHKSWVSENTRKKVQKVIAEHQWTPDRMAAGLVGGSTNLIALILKDVLNPFNSQIVEGINSVLRPLDYNALLLSTMDEHSRELEALKVARSYRVDGMIITPQQVGVDLSHLWKIKEAGEPCITFGCSPGIDFSYLDLDEGASTVRIVGYLSELGHRRIGFLKGPDTSLSAKQREDGFREAVMMKQLEYRPEYSGKGGATLKDGFEGAKKLFSLEVPPTALICYNDLVAAGAYRAAEESGLSIPGDVSIVGFDDIELASVFGPPLTTVRQPCFEMGQWMARQVIAEIDKKRSGEPVVTESKQFIGELIIRESTAPPRGKKYEN